MKKGQKVGVISSFHVGEKSFSRGTNIEVGKDLSLEEARNAAHAGRLATPKEAEEVAKTDEIAKAKAEAAAKAKAESAAKAKAESAAKKKK